MPTSGNDGFQGTQHPFSANPFTSQDKNSDGKPVMGFLFSVSKTAIGEYWPLYVGPNTIGRGSACSICLNEESVSENHATLVIRKMQNKGESSGVFVFIQDTGSMYGTMLNGVTLDFNPKECKNGDIITVGENYELYFVLVDSDAIGLFPKEGFKSSASAPAASPTPAWNPQQPMGFNPNQPKGTLSGTAASPFDGAGRKSTIYMPEK